jgi:hypothetical protein
VIDAFNDALVHAAMDNLTSALHSLPLPMSDGALAAAHAAFLAKAEASLREASFGELDPSQLAKSAEAAARAIRDANFVASQRACDALWAACEGTLKREGGAWLPSTARYAAHVAACNATLEGCVGPAAARFHEVLLPRAASQGADEYAASYRDKLHRAAVGATVFGVLVARFVLRSSILEALCAIAFCVLELLPAALPFGFGASLLWKSSRVEQVVATYESIVYNSWWDLNSLLPALILAVPLLLLLRRCTRARRRRRGAKDGGGSDGLSQVVIAKTE